MKRIKFIISCLTKSIKKKFFKMQKADLSHDCEKLFMEVKATASFQEQKLTEEYAKQYIVTTRWQTV